MWKGSRAEEIHLRNYLRVVQKHLPLLTSAFVVVVVTVGVATFLQRPVYRATTKVLIEREGGGRVVNFQEATPLSGEAAVESFQTQIQVIRSRPVIQQLIDSLTLLTRKPELARASDPVSSLLRRVSVEPVRGTRLVDIHVEDDDPKVAAELTNTLAHAYVNQNLNLKLQAARDALAWLTSQVNDLKEKVNTSEQSLQQYREESGLGSMEEKQGLTIKKLVDFNAAYIEAKARRLEMETKLAELKRAAQKPEELESSPMVINHPLIQNLKAQIVTLEVQRSKLLNTYKEKHPEVVKTQSQIEEMRRRIREEVDRLVRSQDGEYNVLKAREAAMLAAVNQYRDETQSLSKKEIRHGILKREADSNQQLYDVLLKRLKETSLSQGLDNNNIRIVEPAMVPTSPVRPRRMLNMALAVVIGLAVGFSLVFFVEYMDNTVRTPEQAERTLGVPVLAVIPAFPPRRKA